MCSLSASRHSIITIQWTMLVRVPIPSHPSVCVPFLAIIVGTTDPWLNEQQPISTILQQNTPGRARAKTRIKQELRSVCVYNKQHTYTLYGTTQLTTCVSLSADALLRPAVPWRLNFYAIHAVRATHRQQLPSGALRATSGFAHVDNIRKKRNLSELGKSYEPT